MGFSILVLCHAEPLSRWRAALTQALPSDRLCFELAGVAPREVNVVISDLPPKGIWRDFTQLRFIQSLWVGVDRWLDDPSLPRHVPIARMVDPSMVAGMTESVVAHVLHAHLCHDVMRRQQAHKIWRELFNPTAAERSVGIMGMGSLGSTAARALVSLGFRVNGWSRREKSLAGVRCFAGKERLAEFLQLSEIVVCLLPLTDETRGIADASLFAAMPPQSVFIGLGRGAQIVERDLLDALAAGRLRHAILDVFPNEPLPPEHAFWTHEHVTVSPHCASMASVTTGARFIAQNIERLRRGEEPLGLVDRVAGY